jgi:hypothetical protein
MNNFVRILLIVLLPIGLMVGPGRAAFCIVGDSDDDCKVSSEDLDAFFNQQLAHHESSTNLNDDKEVES